MATWGLNMSNYTELAKALRDPEYYRMVAGGLRDTLGRGVIGGALGAPVDITNMAMGALGVPVSQRPVMGSEWLGQKMQDASVVSANRNPVAETLGAFIDPATLGSGVVKLGALGAPAMAGIFAGKGAKTADVVMLSKAEEMAKAGIPDAQIWKETGWALNTPDGMPRFEIPDNNVFQYGPVTDFPAPIKKRFALDDLEKAYPQEAMLPVSGSPLQFAGDSAGSFSNGKITINGGNQQSTALHELQHASQQRR